MDIGFIMPVTAQSGDLAEIARTVEALGYDSLWIPEHPVIPAAMKTSFPFAPDNKLPEHYGRWADPFVALTVAACATKKIKLGTGICLLPEREPLITVKTIASLDLFSGGRVILGVGAGWLREETEAMGANFGLRWKHTREMVEAMKLLWAKGEGAYDGEIIKFPMVRSEPKPVQKAGPPILLGAHGPKALERVARSYDGWMPLVEEVGHFEKEAAALRAIMKKQGRNADTIQMSPLVDVAALSADDLKRYRDAGASRLIHFSQTLVAEHANGKALENARRFAPVVERARAI
ncbi:MAG TPA: LLM class F420-dependent oxidoreductase [Candidatus Binataceae bacterium]|nr:LLM class F420-dependent oxidoreductase [Candidatus Binataceae bacterium]